MLSLLEALLARRSLLGASCNSSWIGTLVPLTSTSEADSQQAHSGLPPQAGSSRRALATQALLLRSVAPPAPPSRCAWAAPAHARLLHAGSRQEAARSWVEPPDYSDSSFASSSSSSSGSRSGPPPRKLNTHRPLWESRPVGPSDDLSPEQRRDAWKPHLEGRAGAHARVGGHLGQRAEVARGTLPQFSKYESRDYVLRMRRLHGADVRAAQQRHDAGTWAAQQQPDSPGVRRAARGAWRPPSGAAAAGGCGDKWLDGTASAAAASGAVAAARVGDGQAVHRGGGSGRGGGASQQSLRPVSAPAGRGRGGGGGGGAPASGGEAGSKASWMPLMNLIMCPPGDTIEGLDVVVREHWVAMNELHLIQAITVLCRLALSSAKREGGGKDLNSGTRRSSNHIRGVTGESGDVNKVPGNEPVPLSPCGTALLNLLTRRVEQALAKRREKQTALARAGVAGAPNHSGEMQMINMLCYVLAKLNRFDGVMQNLLAALPEHNYARIRDCDDARTVGNFMWSISKRVGCMLPLPPGVEKAELSAAVRAAALRHSAKRQPPIWLANVAWAAGILGDADAPLMRAVVEQSMKLVDERLAQLAQLADRGSGDSSTPGAPPNSQVEFNSYHMTSICYGLARAHVYDEPLMTKMGQMLIALAECSDRTQQPTQQAWSNYIWACGNLLHYNADFFDRASPHLVAMIPRVQSAQCLSNIAWALGVLKHGDEGVMQAACTWAINHPGRFNPQELGNMCWAAAVLRAPLGPALIDAVAERATQMYIYDDRMQSIANFGVSLLCLAPTRTDLLSSVVDTSTRWLGEMGEVGVTDHINGVMARRGWRAGGGAAGAREDGAADTSAWEDHATHGARGGGAHDARGNDGEPAWEREDQADGPSSYGERQEDAPPPCVAEWLQHRGGTLQGVVIFCRTLFQCHLELCDQGRADLGLKGEQLETCRAMWQSVITKGPIVSTMHRRVMHVCSDLGLNPGREVLTDDGNFSSDVLIQHPAWGRTALEVDGPYHFLVNHPDIPTGKAAVRNRFVSRRVDRLVIVSVERQLQGLEQHEIRAVIAGVLELDVNGISSSSSSQAAASP